MKSTVFLLSLFLFFAWPAHVGVPAPGPDGLTFVRDEAQAARFGGGRSFGFRGSRGFGRSFSGTPRFGSGYRPNPYGQQRPFFGGGFGRGLFGGLGGLLLGGFIGSMFFGRMGYGGGIGLLEILLIVGVIFFFMRMMGGGRRAGPSYSGRPAYSASDPYGVGGYDAPGEGRAPGPVYTGPDIGSKGSGGNAMPRGPATGPDLHADPRLEEGLRAIAAGDRSFSKENFILDARENFMRFQQAWVARDLNPIREIVDRDIYEKVQGDLDDLRRQGRVNRLDEIKVLGLDIAEAWQEEGFDFVTVRVEASLLDYLIAETSGEVVGGSRTEPVRFAEHWTWARQTGPNKWFLSAIGQV